MAQKSQQRRRAGGQSRHARPHSVSPALRPWPSPPLRRGHGHHPGQWTSPPRRPSPPTGPTQSLENKLAPCPRPDPCPPGPSLGASRPTHCRTLGLATSWSHTPPPAPLLGVAHWKGPRPASGWVGAWTWRSQAWAGAAQREPSPPATRTPALSQLPPRRPAGRNPGSGLVLPDPPRGAGSPVSQPSSFPSDFLPPERAEPPADTALQPPGHILKKMGRQSSQGPRPKWQSSRGRAPRTPGWVGGLTRAPCRARLCVKWTPGPREPGSGGQRSPLKRHGLAGAGQQGGLGGLTPACGGRGPLLPPARGQGHQHAPCPAPDGHRAFLAVSGQMVMVRGSHLPSCAEGQDPPSCPPTFLPGPGPQHCQGTRGSAPAPLAPNRRGSGWGEGGTLRRRQEARQVSWCVCSDARATQGGASAPVHSGAPRPASLAPVPPLS